MELYPFIHGFFAWMVSIAILWPINAGIMALAYKVRHGVSPIDMSTNEFVLRSIFSSLAIAVVTLLAVALDYILVAAEFPAGPIHLVIFMIYVPAGVWIVFVFFAMEDALNAVSQFVIYLFLPIVVLFLINALFGWWEPILDLVRSWLIKPAVST